MNKLLVICGPTATGKTALAVSLAKRLHGELISADSRQVYREMDIGTGKDRDEIDVPIWMLDVVNPNEEFSVSHYSRLAHQAIAEIIKNGKLPIVVGGTGLYIDSLLHNLDSIDIPPDYELRKKLQQATVAELQNMLPNIRMNNSDWNNPRRLIRRIEIERAPKADLENKEKLDYYIAGLTAPISYLFDRINKRVDDRLKKGMKEEVLYLTKKYGIDIPAMSAIGYRSLDTWKSDEQHYAKRQLTWFKKNKNIHWFDITSNQFEENVTSDVLAWYTDIKNEHKI